MNMPTVRMKPNSESALKPEQASAAVEAAALGPLLRRAVEEVHHLVVAKAGENGDERQADQIHFAGIIAGNSRRPQDSQARGQERQEDDLDVGINRQAKQQAADDRDQRDAADVLFDEQMVFFGVDIGPGGKSVNA
jgi:hypothetical protein